jgi:hypothetical protein
MVLVIPQAITHRQVFHLFMEGLREEHSQKLVEWEQIVQEWEDDHSKPSPYALPDTCECSLPLLQNRLPDG